jgi:hypothetical protein
MFKSFGHSRCKTASVSRQTAKPAFECLETRDLLAVSTVSLFAGSVIKDNGLSSFKADGAIRENRSTNTAQAEMLGKAANLGAVPTTAATGQRSGSRHADVIGPIQPHDHKGPSIEDFQAIQETSNIWTFRGRVTGNDVVGLEVRFGGLPSLSGQTATVEENGWFYLTIRLQPGERGVASAQTTDRSGNASNVALTNVNPLQALDYVHRKTN